MRRKEQGGERGRVEEGKGGWEGGEENGRGGEGLHHGCWGMDAPGQKWPVPNPTAPLPQ